MSLFGSLFGAAGALDGRRLAGGVQAGARVVAVLGAVSLLAACAETQLGAHALKTATASGKGGAYKVGKPYKVNGVWYYPKEDPSYDETGVASWYGPQFHGRKTANGETFNMNALTAAHPTLPMPSRVRVTNLENGRSIVVRVNDRGPFAHGRVIDLSRRSAELLGFKGQGLAKVRVQYVSRADGGEAIAAAQPPKAPRTIERAREPVEVQPVAVAASVSAQELPTAAAPRAATARQYDQPDPFRTTAVAPSPGRDPVEMVAVPAHSDLYVQAGAFRSFANAENVERQLRNVGPVEVTLAEIGGATYYRVRLGPMDSVEVADAALEQVLARGINGAKIVVD